MQGFTERQLEQLREEMKTAIIQVLEGTNPVLIAHVPDKVQESKPVKSFKERLAEEMAKQKPEYVTGTIVCNTCKSKNAYIAESCWNCKSPILKPKISEHLYNNGRFKCCCEVCDCGEPKLKDPKLDTRFEIDDVK